MKKTEKKELGELNFMLQTQYGDFIWAFAYYYNHSSSRRKLKTGAGKGRAAGMIQGMETKTQAKTERSYGYAAVNHKLNLWL